MNEGDSLVAINAVIIQCKEWHIIPGRNARVPVLII